MQSVDPSKIVLLSSLVLLAGSGAVFLNVTGAADTLTTDQTYELELRDETLVIRGDETGTEPLVQDLSDVERIEATAIDDQFVVKTTPRELPHVPVSHREQAKRIVADSRSFITANETDTQALYSVYPIPESVSSERAAVVGADAETRQEFLTTVTETQFSVHESSEKTIVFERNALEVSEDRVLTIVDVIDSDVRYSVAVNLRRQTVETVVEFDSTGGLSVNE